MKAIYHYKSYKDYVRNWVKSQPHKGRGQYKAMAEHIRVSTTLVSQIFNGDRDLSLEQAHLLSSFMQLNSAELEYLLSLLLMERSGLVEQKEYFDKKLAQLREDNLQLKKQIKSETLLTKEAEAQYYSDWVHSAIRLLCEIPRFQKIEAIAKHLGVSKEKVQQSIQFMDRVGLVRLEGGKVHNLNKTLHIDKDSPFSLLKQEIWRVKGLTQLQNKRGDQQLFFNALMTIEEKDWKTISNIINDSLKRMHEKVSETKKPEKLCCLNIDFFEV